MQLVQQQAPQALAQTPEIPADQHQAVVQEASQSIFSGMQNLLQQGGAGALKGLFQGVQAQDPANPQVQQLTNQFSGNLSQKMGISGGMARTIGAALIPIVLNKVFHRTKDPADHSFNIQDMLGSLMGGGSTGSGGAMGGGMLGSVLGGMLGGGNSNTGATGSANRGAGSMLDRDGDGDTDLNDLMHMFR